MPDDRSDVRRLADEMAANMRRQLDHATPEELGWPGLTPEELIASEWRCWLREERGEPMPRLSLQLVEGKPND